MANTGLGRGLGSLIPNKNDLNKTSANTAVNLGNKKISTVSTASSEGSLLKVNVDLIKVNPFQPRKEFADTHLEELAQSIKEYGVIQPIIVTKKRDGYELIAGERRLRASKKAGLEKVPVIIREAGEQEKLEVALIENIQRENLNPIDLAHGYRRLIDEFNLTQENAAKRVGKSRPSVTNTLRLLNLPQEIQTALAEGRVTEGYAKYFIGLDSEEKQMNLFRKILHNDLTVSETNRQSKVMGGTKAARIKINYADKDKEFALREFFGAKVEVKRKGKGGQIIIDFYSEEELGEIIEKVK